jgi:hypothetical protein
LSAIVDPEPVVLNEPAVKEMPWQAPVVPVAVAVIEIELLFPVVPKLDTDANPIPPAPCPVIVEEVTLPVVVKAAATFTPLLPPVPPTQLKKFTAPVPVNVLAKWTPWLTPVLLPAPEKVTAPVADQGDVTVTPCDPVARATLVPDRVTPPEVLRFGVLAI